MKVYQPNQRSGTVFAAPAADKDYLGNQEAGSHWLNADGTPKNFQVRFEGGVAEVDKELGEYLIARKYAQRTSLVLPWWVRNRGPAVAAS